MDKLSHVPQNMLWNDLSIPKLDISKRLLIHAVTKVNPWQQKGPLEFSNSNLALNLAYWYSSLYCDPYDLYMIESQIHIIKTKQNTTKQSKHFIAYII